ncbi:TPA: type 1 fimbrial protein [Enterobacter kobei]|nr:type 1 fimbrial protein [Enterobacter kobei]
MLILYAAVLSSVLTGSAGAASDPVAIKVTGSVVDNTCTIDESGSDMTPALDTISARDLKGQGTILGKRDIKLALKDCGKDVTRGIVITASGTPDADDTDGYAFKNADTGDAAATGVGLQFYKSVDKLTPFKATGDSCENITALVEGSNTVTFAAAYVATVAEPGAGSFSTTVNLSLAYQ